MASRLDRLVACGRTGDRERLIDDVADAYGLGPAEVRAELAVIEDHHRRFGSSTIEETVRQLAQELGLAEAELWAEVERISGTVMDRP